MALEFYVIWKTGITADSPKEAAQHERVIQLTPGMSATLFDVWEHAAGKMYRIDLVEQPDRLDRHELLAVKNRLRLLQCNRDTPANIQDLATAFLLFLDRDSIMFKSVHSGP
jgi:hypothetical protein